MRFLPRTRGGVIWRAGLACVLVVGFAAATTAVAGLLKVKSVVTAIDSSAALKTSLPLPSYGAPETLLLVGSDARYGENSESNTDTMMLVRINDKSSTINMLSIPRDLAVNVPGYGMEKINSAWADGGPNLLIQTLQQDVFPGMPKPTHIINITFTAFSDLVNALGGVESMVDHRYYNNTAQTDYSSIDVQPGYQLLHGGVYSSNGNGALAFVRFRHTDSDLVREMRQQDFLRWAKSQYSANDLLSNQSKLTKIFGKYTQSDTSLHSIDGLLDLFDLAVDADGHEIKDIPFQTAGTVAIDGGEDALSFDEETSEHLYDILMTPTHLSTSASTTTTSTTTKTSTSKTKSKSKKPADPIPSGLTEDAGDGISQAGQLGKMSFPVYYPKYIDTDSEYCDAIGETVTPECYDAPNPISEYSGSYPRNYKIEATDGKQYPAYVMTLVLNQALGEYYNVEGTTWQDPPLLKDPAQVVHVNGRTLDLYENTGSPTGDINTVAWHTSKGVYWMSNTLDDALPNDQMIAMAANFALAK